MPKPKRRHRIVDDTQPIRPDHFYRKSEVVRRRLLGYSSPSTVDLKIEAGEIDRPVALSETGRATGWYGRTILKIQQAREAKAAAKNF
jgi:hypothetical protein